MILRFGDQAETPDATGVLDQFTRFRVSSVEGHFTVTEEVARSRELHDQVSVARIFVTLDQHRKHLGHVATLSLDGISDGDTTPRYAVKPEEGNSVACYSL